MELEELLRKATAERLNPEEVVADRGLLVQFLNADRIDGDGLSTLQESYLLRNQAAVMVAALDVLYGYDAEKNAQWSYDGLYPGAFLPFEPIYPSLAANNMGAEIEKTKLVGDFNEFLYARVKAKQEEGWGRPKITAKEVSEQYMYKVRRSLEHHMKDMDSYIASQEEGIRKMKEMQGESPQDILSNPLVMGLLNSRFSVTVFSKKTLGALQWIARDHFIYPALDGRAFS